MKIKKDLCKYGWHPFAYYIFILLIFDEITCILSSSFVVFCFEFQRAWIWFFFFFKKEFTLPVFSFKESIDFGTIRNNNTVEKQPESSPGWILLHFLVLLEIDGKNHAFPIW